MSLFGNIFGAGVDRAQKGAVSAIATHLPDLASEAQLRTYADQVEQLGGVVARAQSRVAEDEQQVASLRTNLDRMKAAARVLLGKKESGDTSVESALSQALAQAESLKAELEAATKRAEQSKADLQKSVDDHQSAADHLTAARQRLEDARRDNARAESDLAREKQRQHDAEVAAGVAKGFNPDSAIEDAMSTKLKKTNEQAAAARATADALNRSADKTGGGDALKAALAEVDGSPSKPTDAAARLSALD